MIDIKPYNDSNLDCYEAAVASYLKWINYNYVMIFENSWGVYFAEDKTQDGSSALEKYYGIRISNFAKRMTINDVRKEIDLNIEPLIVNTNIYDCHWISSYRKYYSKHILLVLDIYEDKMLCIDPYFSDTTQLFNYKDCIAQKISCAKFKKTSIKRDDNDSFLIQELKKIVKLYNDNNLFVKLLDSHNYLGIVKPYAEFDCLELEYNKALLKLDRIAKNRANYSNMLEYINSIDSSCDLQDFVQRFKELSEQWSLCRRILIKYCMTKKESSRDDFNGLFRTMAELEQYLCKELYTYLFAQ